MKDDTINRAQDLRLPGEFKKTAFFPFLLQLQDAW